MNKMRNGVFFMMGLLLTACIGCTQQNTEHNSVKEKTIMQQSEKQNTERNQPTTEKITPKDNEQVNVHKKEAKKLTLIELGSVKCIPCKKMAPILDEIKTNYADEVDVVFYDVWTREGKPYASTYNIRIIPTQVFLDRTGKEYFRHEGFFSREEIMAKLTEGGLKR